MADEPSEVVTLPRVLDDLPSDLTRRSFAVVGDRGTATIEVADEEEFDTVVAAAAAAADLAEPPGMFTDDMDGGRSA